MRLIALFGPKGAGKDECARIFADLTAPRSSIRIEFAAPIRWACDALGLPFEATRSRKNEPCAELGGRPGRDVLVAVGEAVRGLDPLYFVRHAIGRAPDLGADLVTISDGRTVDEARAVRAAGGACVWVHRPSAHERRAEDAVLQPEAHGLCDHEVQNTGDLAHLRAECARVLATLGVEVRP